MANGLRRLRLLGGAALLLSVGGCASLGLGEAGGGMDAQAARLVRMGDYAMSHGEPVTAISLYEQALSLDPGAEEARSRLGRIQEQLGADVSALDTYRNAVDRAPDDPFALRRLANALIAETYPEKAIPYLQRALEIEDSTPVRNSLGVALDLIGDHGAAQEQYRTGIASAPGDLDLGNNLALSLALAGDYDAAVAMASQVTLNDESTSRHRQTYALVLGLAGRTDEAAAVARRDLSPDQVAANLDYYDLLRSIEPSSARAIAITGGIGAPGGGPADTQVGFLVEGIDRAIAPTAMIATLPH